MGHLIQQAPLPAPGGKDLPQLPGPGGGAAVPVSVPGQVPPGQMFPRKRPVQLPEKILPLALAHGHAKTGINEFRPRVRRAVHDGQHLLMPVLQKGEHRHEQHPAEQPGLGQAPDCRQPLGGEGARGSTLAARSSSTVVTVSLQITGEWA